MMPISKLYKIFTWMHPNGTLIPAALGAVTSPVLFALKRKTLNAWKKDYTEYAKHMPQADSGWFTYLGCHLIYGVIPCEYFLYRFDKLNDSGRRGFLTNISRYQYYEMFNQETAKERYYNKYITYQDYRQYFHRDAMLVSDATDEQALADFVSKHNRFIVKPLRLYMGYGIEIMHETAQSCADLKQRILKKGECIIEELVVQSETMGALHASSVNTIRVPAFRLKDGVVIHRPFLRVGIGSAVVDNGGSGGILIAVDAETGVTVSKGMDELGNEYLYHPDTKKCLVGFQIPQWDEVKALVTELMQVDPETRYIGWDLAHTDHGWAVIEANDDGQFVAQQMTLKTGCTKEIAELATRI